MPRVKGGTTTKARRKKILKLAKGYVGSKRLLYKTANEQVMKSLSYAYRDRRQKKREFRKLWISRINAACKLHDFKYSKFINGLALANIQLNRKVLAEIAVENPDDFKNLVELSKDALEGKLPKKAKVKTDEKPFKELPKKAAVIEPVEKVESTSPVKKTTVKKTSTSKKTTSTKTSTKKTTSAKKTSPKKTTTPAKKTSPKKTTTTKTKKAVKKTSEKKEATEK